MLTLLPLIAFGLINIIIGDLRRAQDWRRVFLLSAAAWGSLVVLNTEILSAFHCLNSFYVSIFWMAVIGAGVAFLPRRKLKLSLPVIYPLQPLDRVLVFFLIAIPGVISVTAWMSAPNNWDSLVYHMSRVAHWEQNQSVAHYPTNIKPQIYYPPWAGYAILQFQVLTGSDRMAHFIQWFSMIGSMVAVSLISRLLGASLRYQLFSAMLSMTVAMGLLQASTTQNDYVAAFWAACFVYFYLAAGQQKSWDNYLGAGASLGLAMLTKATVYLYVLPFLFYFVIRTMRREKSEFFRLAVCGLSAFSLNAGHYWRNWSAAGNIFGEAEIYGVTRNEAMSVGLWLSNILRNIGLHLGTSSSALNGFFEKIILSVHKMLNLDLTDARISLGSGPLAQVSVHEDAAGNFVHLVLIGIALWIVVREWRRPGSPEIREYVVCLLVAFALFAFLLRWQPSGSRLHLPGFILWTPLIGVAIERWQGKKVIALSVIITILFCTAIPYVFRASGRRIYSMKKSTVFNTPRREQYFANDRRLLGPYQEAIRYIQAQGCSQVGLYTGSNVWEYPLWVFMREEASGKSFRLEHVRVSGKAISSYPLGDFRPCAVIQLDRDNDLTVLDLGSGQVFVRHWENRPLKVLLPIL